MTPQQAQTGPEVAASRQEALTTGATRYHGRPCKCGGTVRYRANATCVSCQRKRQRAYYYESGRADHMRAYYEANRERIAKRQRAYYEANRERLAARSLAYYHDVICADHLKYYGHLLKGRRREALKRKEARHGQIQD